MLFYYSYGDNSCLVYILNLIIRKHRTEKYLSGKHELLKKIWVWQAVFSYIYYDPRTEYGEHTDLGAVSFKTFLSPVDI